MANDPTPARSGDAERERVLALVKRHGWNATAFQVLERGFRYWFDDDACVAYVDTGRGWVAAGVGAGPARDPEPARAAPARARQGPRRETRDAGRDRGRVSPQADGGARAEVARRARHASDGIPRRSPAVRSSARAPLLARGD